MKAFSLLIILFIAVSTFAAGLPKSAFFVANEGQWEGEFAFKYSGGGAVWYITPEGMTIDFKERREPARRRMDEPWLDREEPQLPEWVRGHVVKISSVNGNRGHEIIGENKLSHYSNYIFGSDSCQWRTRVGHYQTVIAKNVWPGVDVEYRIAPEGIESVYHVAAGVDPAVVQLRYEGLDAPLRMDSEGNLVLKTSLGEFREKAPLAWQVWQGQREDVGIAFQLTSRNECRLFCPGYDRRLPMTIDPLLYGGYLGGESDDYSNGLWIADDGSVVVVGVSGSVDFPTTPGVYQEDINSGGSGFVCRLSADGDSLLMSTFLGRTDVSAVCTDLDGTIWSCGRTLLNNLPLTAGAFDTTFEGNNEGLLVGLSADGTTLLYCSFMGGRYSDFNTGAKIQRDANGWLYITGAASCGYPATPDALFPVIDTTHQVLEFGLLSVFNPAALQLEYSSQIPANDISTTTRSRVISPGRIWIWGYTRSTDFPVTADAIQSFNASDTSLVSCDDGVFMLWNVVESRLEYSSYFGSTGSDGINDLWIIDSTRLVLCGGNNSTDFPVSPGAFDSTIIGGGSPFEGYISIIALPGTLLRSTYLGGNLSSESTEGVTASSRGIVVIGYTGSSDFPVTPDAFDNTYGGTDDAFAVRLDTTLTHLEYGTFLGGGNVEYVNGCYFTTPDCVWIVGQTGSADFPVTPNAYQTTYHGWGDGFILGFEIPAPNSVSPSVQPIPAQPWLTAYPNPFNSSAQIAFMLPTTQKVTLRLYDVLGREVMLLMDKTQPAGKHVVQFDGGALSSGTYFCRMQAGEFSQAKKIVLMK